MIHLLALSFMAAIVALAFITCAAL
jgi:hypothetical protein